MRESWTLTTVSFSTFRIFSHIKMLASASTLSGTPYMFFECTDVLLVLCRTGSAFSWVVVAPRDKVKINGDVKTYAKKGDSGNDVHRIFCGFVLLDSQRCLQSY